jgi:hypothetical protein
MKIEKKQPKDMNLIKNICVTVLEQLLVKDLACIEKRGGRFVQKEGNMSQIFRDTTKLQSIFL